MANPVKEFTVPFFKLVYFSAMTCFLIKCVKCVVK